MPKSKKKTAVQTPITFAYSSSEDDDDILHYKPFSTDDTKGSKSAKKNGEEDTTSRTSIVMAPKSTPILHEEKLSHDHNARSNESKQRKRNFQNDKKDVTSEGEVEQEESENEDEIIRKAQERANLSSLPTSQIKSSDELCWQKSYNSKTKKYYGKTPSSKRRRKIQPHQSLYIYYPVRICHKDEAFGLDLPQHWDENKHVLVQYINGCFLDERSLILKKMIIPYHGLTLKQNDESCKNDDNQSCSETEKMNVNTPADKDAKNHDDAFSSKVSDGLALPPSQWCTEKIKLLEERRLNIDKWSKLDCYAERFYLQRILDLAMQEEQSMNKYHLQQQQQQQYSENDQVIITPLQSQQYDETQESNNECNNTSKNDQDDGPNCSISDSEDMLDMITTAKNTKKEILRPGDVIEYYNPMFRFGDTRGLRQTRIFAIKSRTEQNVLELENGEFLPTKPLDTQIKRTKIMHRNNLIDNPHARFQGILQYSLKKGSIKDSNVGGGIRAEVAHVTNIVKEGFKTLHKLIEKEGVPLDLLRCFKDSDEGCTNDIDEQDPSSFDCNTNMNESEVEGVATSSDNGQTNTPHKVVKRTRGSNEHKLGKIDEHGGPRMLTRSRKSIGTNDAFITEEDLGNNKGKRMPTKTRTSARSLSKTPSK